MSFQQTNNVKVHKVHTLDSEGEHTVDKRNQQSIGIICAPFNKGQGKEGTELGPSAIKETGFIEKLQTNNFNVRDCGEVAMLPKHKEDIGPDNMKNFKQVLEYAELLKTKVKDTLQQHDLCITLGGDHAIAMGTVSGLADLNPNHQVKLLWIDAHPDVHTGASSQSKNMHGMPVSFLLHGRETQRLDGQSLLSCINPKDIVYIALRDTDQIEQEYLDNTPGLMYFTMEDVRHVGISNVLKISLEWLNPGPQNPLHVSFDIDSLDPSVAPSTGTPVEGGLTLDEGKTILQTAYNTGYLRSLDISEVNPKLGSKFDAEKTAMAAHDLILTIANNQKSNIED